MLNNDEAYSGLSPGLSPNTVLSFVAIFQLAAASWKSKLSALQLSSFSDQGQVSRALKINCIKNILNISKLLEFVKLKQ